MKRLILAALLTACNATPVTETTTGTQGTAPVTRVSGELQQTVTSLHATIGARYAATITPPAADSSGAVNPLALATFTLPLPSTLQDAQLSRFYELFAAPTCTSALTGNTYARMHFLSVLNGPGDTPFSSAMTVTANGVTTRTQATYLYADRATYLRGTVRCPAASGGADVTGFELNLTAGWNRVLRADRAGQVIYATVSRDNGSNVTPELWKAVQ